MNNYCQRNSMTISSPDGRSNSTSLLKCYPIDIDCFDDDQSTIQSSASQNYALSSSLPKFTDLSRHCDNTETIARDDRGLGMYRKTFGAPSNPSILMTSNSFKNEQSQYQPAYSSVGNGLLQKSKSFTAPKLPPLYPTNNNSFSQANDVNNTKNGNFMKSALKSNFKTNSFELESCRPKRNVAPNPPSSEPPSLQENLLPKMEKLNFIKPYNLCAETSNANWRGFEMKYIDDDTFGNDNKLRETYNHFSGENIKSLKNSSNVLKSSLSKENCIFNNNNNNNKSQNYSNNLVSSIPPTLRKSESCTNTDKPEYNYPLSIDAKLQSRKPSTLNNSGSTIKSVSTFSLSQLNEKQQKPETINDGHITSGALPVNTIPNFLGSSSRNCFSNSPNRFYLNCPEVNSSTPNYTDSCAKDKNNNRFIIEENSKNYFDYLTETNDNIHDDTGIDSSGSTVSSLGSTGKRKNSCNNFSSSFSSSNSFSPQQETTSSELPPRQPPPPPPSLISAPQLWTFNAQNQSTIKYNGVHNGVVENCSSQMNKKIVNTENVSLIDSVTSNAIRRKLSAHSKVKSKRTSVLSQSYFDIKSYEHDTSDNNQFSDDNGSTQFGQTMLSDTTFDEKFALIKSQNNVSDKYCASNIENIDGSDDDNNNNNNVFDFEYEGNVEQCRSGLVVRQQPALKVKAIIDKLMYMSGRDQRRALFSLKSIFQSDKDLVHEFVRNGGLECLIKIGRSSDQNNQNYILRGKNLAIGQLMLYVDGMNGIISNNETICWLYELLNSPYRLVVKTAMKLLLVFIEYTESNSLLLLAAISKVEKANGLPDWHSLMRILNERHASDEETLVFGMTVINKTLNGVPDQDTFFDIVDCLEGQGIEEALRSMLKISNAQLIQQCNHYEQEVRKEDAALESDSSIATSGTDIVRMRMNGNVYSCNNSANARNNNIDRCSDRARRQKLPDYRNETSNIELNGFNHHNNRGFEQQNNQSNMNGFNNTSTTITTTAIIQTGTHAQQQQQPSWRRPQGDDLKYKNLTDAEVDNDISARFNKNLKLNNYNYNDNNIILNNNKNNMEDKNLIGVKACPPQKIELFETQAHDPATTNGNNVDGKENIDAMECNEEEKQVKAPPPSIPTNIFSPTELKTMEFPEPTKAPPLPPPPPPQPSSFTANQEKPTDSKADSDDDTAAGSGFAALLQKRAKKMENSAFRRNLTETRQSESEVKWKEAAGRLKEKPMIINDLDFSEFVEFEQDPLVLVRSAAQQKNDTSTVAPISGIPPAPPPIPGANGVPPPPPAFGAFRGRESSPAPSISSKSSVAGTLKLHWKPAQAEAPPIPALKLKGTFWNQVASTPPIDTSKLSRLFEQKTKEVPVKKTGSESKPQVLQVLSVKRSQAINIGLTKLPPITVIPTAIRKFDASVLNKEGIEKILSTMMPSVEEVERIQERQAENPDTPLGQAEQFMISLSEIDCLLERLRLWLFMLDYHNLEKDVAESLMELNNAMKEVEESKTFRVAMGMLLTIGNALNGTDIKAFQLDYLSRASEVKDPVHKYPLTHHLSEYMLDNYPEGTDLYSELGAVSRSSRIDFDAVLDNLKKMEMDCKASFDYVAKISQRDNNSSMKNKVNVFLTEVAERIHRLKHVHRTTIHRWNAFLLYFGYAPVEVKEQKPINVFKMVIEFALEYRTNRDKILQMRKRMAEKRERNKTRGMMIGMAQAHASTSNSTSSTTQTRRQRDAQNTQMTDHERHQEMSRLLTTSMNGDDSTLSRRRAGQPTPERALIVAQTEAMRTTGTELQDDELLDGVVRTVTAQADFRDHNRRRARLFNRKSLRRTRTIRHDQLVDLNNLSNY